MQWPNQEGGQTKREGGVTLLGWRQTIARVVLGDARKVVHGGRRWWHRRRWEKTREKVRPTKGENLEKRWFFANFSH